MKSKTLDGWIGKQVYVLPEFAHVPLVLLEYGSRWVVVRDEQGRVYWTALSSESEITLAWEATE